MRRRIDGVDEVLDGHGRDELVGVQFGALAVRGLVDHGFDTALCLTNLDDLGIGDDGGTGVDAPAPAPSTWKSREFDDQHIRA